MATILCVDDDKTYHDLYDTILQMNGYSLAHAYELADGLAQARATHPDLIILDVMMPESGGLFDGYALLKAVRGDSDLKKTPILMISALKDDTDVKHGTGEGAASYLPKQHMTPEKLTSAIRTLLGEH